MDLPCDCDFCRSPGALEERRACAHMSPNELLGAGALPLPRLEPGRPAGPTSVVGGWCCTGRRAVANSCALL